MKDTNNTIEDLNAQLKRAEDMHHEIDKILSNVFKQLRKSNIRECLK